MKYNSVCRSGLSFSLGSFRCIPCTEYWYQNLIGIVIAAFIVGIALAIFILALNMTVAVGTLNGILFYAHIVATNPYTSCHSQLQLLSLCSYHSLILISTLIFLPF